MVSITAGEVLRAARHAPASRRARRELSYCLAGLVPGLAGFMIIVTLLASGAGLAITLLGTFPGLLVLVITLRLASRLGALHRWLARRLLGGEFPGPRPFRPGRGLLGRLDARLRDGAAWRAVGYVALKLPVALLQAYALLFWWSGLYDVTGPLWWGLFRSHPTGTSLSPVAVMTPVPGVSFGVSTWPGTLGMLIVGAAVLLAAPWVTRAVIAGDRWLIRSLLGPAQLDQRVEELEQSRAHAVDDAAAALRQVERDLHDGAQVRLAALAMGLGMAKEKLGDDAGQPLDRTEVARIRDLVDSAHRNAKEALVELRDLARGIHPPVLDAGLADALATLAARSLIPVEVTTDIGERPTPAIETIAYFCAAELLANAAKHSGANQVAVDVTQRGETLRLRVSDDGAGGADPSRGSGLPGLVQRVRTVDGRFHLTSPAGGPTVVTVELPLRA